MKRPSGLIASAVVLSLASLGQVVMALLMVVVAEIKPRQDLAQAAPGGTTMPPPPPWMPYVMYAMALFFLGLAVWGILTAIGLHRLRRWARVSVLIIGGCMAAIGAFSALAMVMMMFVPLPLPPSSDTANPQTIQAMVKVGFVVIALFYAAVAAIGIWWLVYFNRQNVRALFANPDGLVQESRRPLLISIFAVLQMFGGPTCMLMAFLPFPALIMGLVLRGWEKGLLFVVFAALATAAGVGLWQLKEWGRRLTLALMAFGVSNCLTYIVWPSLLIRMSEEINKSMHLPQSALPEHFQRMMFGIEMVPSILLFIALAFMLHYYRDRFREPAPPPPFPTLPPEPGMLEP